MISQKFPEGLASSGIRQVLEFSFCLDSRTGKCKIALSNVVSRLYNYGADVVSKRRDFIRARDFETVCLASPFLQSDTWTLAKRYTTAKLYTATIIKSPAANGNVKAVFFILRLSVFRLCKE